MSTTSATVDVVVVVAVLYGILLLLLACHIVKVHTLQIN